MKYQPTILEHHSFHIPEKSHDCLLMAFSTGCGDIKVKFTYEAYNGVERCNTEVFDRVGLKWNQLFNIFDLGCIPDGFSYLKCGVEREERASHLFAIAGAMVDKIL